MANETKTLSREQLPPAPPDTEWYWAVGDEEWALYVLTREGLRVDSVHLHRPGQPYLERQAALRIANGLAPAQPATVCCMCSNIVGDSPSPVACRECAEYAFDAVGMPRNPDPRLEWCDELNELNQEWAAGDIADGARAIEFMRRCCAVIGTTLGDEGLTQSKVWA